MIEEDFEDSEIDTLEELINEKRKIEFIIKKQIVELAAVNIMINDWDKNELK